VSYNAEQFAEKYRLARESAAKAAPEGGLCGFELEWNLLDARLKPLLTVGSGPSQVSFVDYLRAERLPAWAREFSQLEVFHWMIEWATRPYYSPRAAVYEGRLLEATLINALHQAGAEFGEKLYHWHGNLLFKTPVGFDSIPTSWHLAKRRYLERCVSLYGETLATAGTHTNLSLPDPLFAWDFMHLSAAERGDRHLDAYKSEFYITATRLMRAFAALFIAASASTPLQAEIVDGEPVVRLTANDSVRNLTFPNPADIDLPDLYRSYDDYLQKSYSLVRSGVRFGNNNWTPVRARSFAEPVERLIAITSDQLNELYSRGLYSVEAAPAPEAKPQAEDTARQIEIQNLMARINLPMARVEVRTDDGGHPLDVEIANLTLKHLLLGLVYADPDFGRAFRYDREDIQRARRNEEAAARDGLRAVIENPFTGKPVEMRAFLRWTLNEARPLAECLELWEDLKPLVEMVEEDAPNTAERIRRRLRQEIGERDDVPLELLLTLAEERQAEIARDVETIAETYQLQGPDSTRLSQFLQRARDDVHLDRQIPVRFRPRQGPFVELLYPDKTSEIVALAEELVRIPSVTACPEERLEEVRRAATFIYDYARNRGLAVEYYDREKYPALMIGFPGRMDVPVMLSGHFDVVQPDPDDSQFNPHIEGDYLWGRGAADMKTVAATFLVWMKDILRTGAPFPPISLLLVGNEENGESEPMGTPHVLGNLAQVNGYAPQLLIAGERTGEKGDEPWGEICTQNRGVMRFQVRAFGKRVHAGTASAAQAADLLERLIQARGQIDKILAQHLRLTSPDGWQSQRRFPFLLSGSPGVYNVTPETAVLGVEIRPIPGDDLWALEQELKDFCQASALELQIEVMENGIACDPENPYLKSLISAVGGASGSEPVIGRKLPATSARFAPGGMGVVWGQSGIGPHASDERHYIPSILPYYRALDRYGALLKAAAGNQGL
jgi:acetylornithine deacetylase/succinyl-diaminopimelate desuccinylase-like protein/gamma-glutamyl:cysteine ligase YbdK (ATP-grasp superfamily)